MYVDGSNIGSTVNSIMSGRSPPLYCILALFKKNLNASKPSEHPPSGEKMSKGLGGNIGCRDKTSSWYQTDFPM